MIALMDEMSKPNRPPPMTCIHNQLVALRIRWCNTYGDGRDNIHVPDLPHLYYKARLIKANDVAKSDSNQLEVEGFMHSYSLSMS